MTTCPHCGAEIGSGRSVPHLRRYFAMIRAAYSHWPESHQRQFGSEEEFRKWLQMKAGHRETRTVMPLAGMRQDTAVTVARAAFAAAGTFAEPVEHKGTLYIHTPKSIAFDKLGHQAACALFNEVDAVIEDETGTSGSQYLTETERAA